MDLARIRNFSIIAHIDHGKSTLSDRILELTGAVDARDMRAQYLDSMDLERERGITIKAQNVRVDWQRPRPPPDRHAGPRRLRLRGVAVAGRVRGRGPAWSTPPRASRPRRWPTATWPSRTTSRSSPRSTRSTCRRPTPTATPRRSRQVLGIPADEILRISAKTGEGVPELLDAVVERIPAPDGRRRRAAAGADLRLATSTSTAASCQLGAGDERHAARPARGCGSCRPAPIHEADEVGVRAARCRRRSPSSARARSATSSPASRTSARPAPARPSPRPAARRRARSRATATRSRWCSAGSTRSTATTSRTCARRSRSCGSTTRRSPTSPRRPARSGFGFRCGFLGLLHMEIVRERLEREFDLALIATAPSVEYRVHTHRRRGGRGRQPGRHARAAGDRVASRSRTSRSRSSRPPTYTGTLMDLCQTRRGEMQKLEYLSPERVELVYRIPLAEVVDRLLRPAEEPHPGLRQPRLRARRLRSAPNLVKVDILLNGVPADAFSTIVHRDKAVRLRPADVREAQRADPAADVRRADPGGDRRARSSPARR